jgi:biopolymer transport protein ExbB
MKRAILISGCVIGALLALGPLWGLLGTVFGMIGAFDTVSQESSPKANVLAEGISHAMNATILGCVASPIGIVILVLCAAKLFSRSRS